MAGVNKRLGETQVTVTPISSERLKFKNCFNNWKKNLTRVLVESL